MQSYEVILSIVKKGYSFYKADQAGLVIKEIWKTLKDVYSDIASAHFTSAQSAFLAARKSNAPDTQIRIAIGHLTVAFHIYQGLLTKTKTERTLLIFTEEVPLVSAEEQPQIKMCLFEIATCIAINYADLRERDNGRAWKEKAMKYIDDYLNAKTAHLDGEYIYQNVNKNYVEVETGRRIKHISGSGAVYSEDYIDYHLNDSGSRYIEQQRERVLKATTDIYRAKRIE